MAGELLRVMVGQVTHQWHDIVILDESWVYLYIEHEMMWVSLGEAVPDRGGR
jgi:translation initiation factor RLI1